MTRLSGILVALVLLAVPAAAQYVGYHVPGSLSRIDRVAPDAVLRDLQDARWRIGPIHLDPRLSIGDLGYIDNIYSSTEDDVQSDLKARGDAGLRAFAHLGPKVVTTGFANASYSWWRQQEDLRSFNESLGLQLFGFFNRLRVQVEAGRVETQRNLSSEVEVPVDVQTDRLGIDLDIDLRGPLRLFAAASESRNRFFGEAARRQLPSLALDQLDRTAESVRAGIAYDFRGGLSLSLGADRTDTVFEDDPAGRSTRAAGPLLRAEYYGNRLSVRLDAYLLDVEFSGRESGQDRQQFTGVGQLGWRFSEKLSTGLYGATQLDSSALAADTVFESRRYGASVERQLRPRLTVRAFYETGEDEFFTVSDDGVSRLDDFTTYGLGLEFKPTRRATVEIGFYDSRRDSSDPLFARDLTSVTSRIRVGGNLLPW